MTRDMAFRKDNSQCVWKGSMLDTVLPYTGNLEVSKAYPSHSAIIAKKEAMSQA